MEPKGAKMDQTTEAIRLLTIEVARLADAASTPMRDRFAMAALTGILAQGGGWGTADARAAYELADMMLAARGGK